jgi:hypothetical protein
MKNNNYLTPNVGHLDIRLGVYVSLDDDSDGVDDALDIRGAVPL